MVTAVLGRNLVTGNSLPSFAGLQIERSLRISLDLSIWAVAGRFFSNNIAFSAADGAPGISRLTLKSFTEDGGLSRAFAVTGLIAQQIDRNELGDQDKQI
jgi:hypothetical protein